MPREDVELDLSKEEKTCPCCLAQMEKSHEKYSEKLHIKPARFCVKRFIMPVYKCKDCEEVKQAKMPPHPIAKCSATLETLVYIGVSKYLDGLPLHRQEKIFNRKGIEIGRDKMSRWMIRLSEKLNPIYELMHAKLLEGDLIGMDETRLQVLKENGRRADSKSYMVIQAREGPPGKSISLFHYEKSRSSETISRYLEGYSGSFITDGLASYQSFSRRNNSISHGGCLAHARRKFTDAVKASKSSSKTAKEMIKLIKEIFKIEKKIKNASIEARYKTRQKESKHVMKKMEKLWQERIELIPKKSLLGAALHYMKNQWNFLYCFIDDPLLPCHNNYVEQQIRPFVIGRKAWMFSDTPEGARASAIIYSLIITAKENKLNPADYLTNVLYKIDTAEDLSTLLPFS